MRFDVLKPDAVAAAKFAHRADLIDDVVDQFFVGGLDEATAKALKVAIAGMRAKPDAVDLGQFDHPIHGVRITGVKPCGDVGRRDQCHQIFVGRFAQDPMAKALTHVAI